MSGISTVIYAMDSNTFNGRSPLNGLHRTIDSHGGSPCGNGEETRRVVAVWQRRGNTASGVQLLVVTWFVNATTFRNELCLHCCPTRSVYLH